MTLFFCTNESFSHVLSGAMVKDSQQGSTYLGAFLACFCWTMYYPSGHTTKMVGYCLVCMIRDMSVHGFLCKMLSLVAISLDLENVVVEDETVVSFYSDDDIFCSFTSEKTSVQKSSYEILVWLSWQFPSQSRQKTFWQPFYLLHCIFLCLFIPHEHDHVFSQMLKLWPFISCILLKWGM